MREPIDEHIRRRHLELGQKVLARKRVYLDTRFWILLRDVALGRRDEPDLVALLDSLTDGVRRCSMVCPIEASVVAELFRQSDLETRLATARIMDRLSEGVCLSCWEDRCRGELLYFLRRHKWPDRKLRHPRELVWTKIGQVFGETVPRLRLADPAEEATIQIGFYDHVWVSSIEEAVRTIGATPIPRFDDGHAAARLTTDKRRHAAELRSIQQAFLIELRGGLDAGEDLLAGALRHLIKAETIQSPDVTPTIGDDSIRNFKAFIVAEARKGNLGRDLAVFQIPARLNAALRWDRRRAFQPTDLMDFMHASAALPYCNLFLTDKPLAALLRSGEVRLDKEYGVPVSGDLREAVEYVRQMAAI